MTMLMVFAVLFFAAGLRLGRRDPEAMTTRRKKQEKPVRVSSWGIDRQSGNRSSRRVVFPGAAPPGTAPESSFFPVRDLSKDFFRLVENDLLQILQYKGRKPLFSARAL
ncbi:MAG: hypothetical protein ABSD96_17210 [Candidatus Korobacteraceae bacterium]